MWLPSQNFNHEDIDLIWFGQVVFYQVHDSINYLHNGSWAHLELECHMITVNKIHQYVVMNRNYNQGYHLRESSPGCW